VSDDPYDAFFDERRVRAREREVRRRERQGRRQPRTARLRMGGELGHLVETPAGRVLAGIVAGIAVLTVVGLMVLWPHGDHATGARIAASVPAHVTQVTEAACDTPTPQTCRTTRIELGDHTKATMSLGPTTSAPAVQVGEAIRIERTVLPKGTKAPPHFEAYTFVDVDRHGSLLWLCVAVAALAVILLRVRGLLAVAGVGLSLAIVLYFLVPAILDGRPAMLVALVAALAVMFITLVLTNGIGAQTLAAALGISATLALTCGLAALGVHLAHLDGKGDELALSLGVENSHLSLQGIVLAGMLIGALGVIGDTAVTQASAVMALRRTDPTMSVVRLYREAFTVGRDHLSATIHTLVLAYTGAALPLLLALRQTRLPLVDALNAQTIAEPIVATVVGCAALMVAVPLTTSLAAGLIARVPPAALPDHGGHGHAH
jgi:uncharacterized membrane protein